MKFNYFVSNDAGWAGVSIIDKGISLDYSVSYCMGDDLEELLCGLIAFSGYKSHYNIFHDLLERYLDDDNDYFNWEINQEGSTIWFQFKKTDKRDIINLSIIENYEKQNCSYRNDISLTELIDDILNSCKNILNELGIIGYYRNYWKTFPITYFLMLSDYKYNKINYEDIINNKFRENDTLYKTEINTEIEYIKGVQ